MIFLAVLILFIIPVQAQKLKFDSTLRSDKVGYRIMCNNKSPESNIVSITPIGFVGNNTRTMDFMITGRIVKAAIDDFNGDGYPDLIFYSYDEKDRAQVYSLASSENKSCVPIFMTDIYADPKLRQGYQGHDEFSIMEGFLIRKFPLYKITDSTTKKMEVIGKRVIQYKAVGDKTNPDRPSFSFKIFKTFDIKE